jgi:site-specific DNA-methyltransferase (adenine-specific)
VDFVTNYELTLGDCVEGMRDRPALSVDIIVTSPPYNLGKKYRSYEDDLEEKDYLDWTERWTTAVARITRAKGHFFLNVAGSPSNPWLPHLILLRLRPLWKLQNTIHWIKSITLDDAGELEAISRGHFKPINSKRFLNDTHEYIFHLTPHGDSPVNRLGVGVQYADKSNIKRWSHTSGRDKRCRGTSWFIPYETIQNRDIQRPHPAAFPVKLPEMCLRLAGAGPESVVCDPFLGIGGTSVAAAKLGIKNFVGYELDEGYLREARRRTLAATNL